MLPVDEPQSANIVNGSKFRSHWNMHKQNTTDAES